MGPRGESTDRQQDLGAVARGIIDSNAYMTIATADGAGLPWASPVWYAAAGYAEFYWVSSPEARHSRNLVARSEVSLVVFDSRGPIGKGQTVYVSAIVEELTGANLERGLVSSLAGPKRMEQARGSRRTFGCPPSIVCTERPRRNIGCSIRAALWSTAVP
jgi:Pyridoxamine 5'-phosphate oxidase